MRNSSSKSSSYCLFVISLTLLSQFLSPQSVHAISSNPSKIVCRIEVDDAHISTFIRKFMGVRAVKVDTRSTCSTRQEQVRLTVEIFKLGKFFNHFVFRDSTPPFDSKSSGFVVTNYKTFKLCKNSVSTQYFGVAYSRALIQGKWKNTVRTRSLHSVTLKCGT